MFRIFAAISPLVIFISTFSSVVGACLPCQATFRRPELARRTLHTRDTTGGIHILNPSYRSVWLNGELQLVTWNTTEVESHTGTGSSECQVYLGQWDWNTKDYRKIYFDYPLATNCSLYDGNTTVRVPKDEKFKPANNWVVVLFNRNSEDHSAPFTITTPPKDQQQST